MTRGATVAATVVLVLAAAAAAVLLNLVLLDRASSRNDPVGKLRPQANLPAAPQVVRPQTGPTHGEDDDD